MMLKKFSKLTNFTKYYSKKALITVAITGDVPSQNRLAVVPIHPKDQIQDIIKCFEAGARMVHIHVRDDDGKPTWKHEKYHQVIEGVQKYCPEMLVQFTTGNYGPNLEERTECFKYKPDMASLTPGSVNFKNNRKSANQYINTHHDIEEIAKKMLKYNIKPDVAIFDVSMIYATEELVRKKLIQLPVKLMYVMGGWMALNAKKSLLEFMVKESEEAFGKDNFIWTAVGVGWNHEDVLKWTLEMNGHPRTGIEDTLMIKRGVYVTGNEQLVKYTVEVCQKYGREIMTPKEARELLKIPSN